MTPKQLRQCLGERYWNDFQNEWDAEKHRRKEAEEAKAVFKRYVMHLRNADRLEGLADKRHSITIRHRAEHHYESALECLSETLETHPHAERWLDRPFDWNDVNSKGAMNSADKFAVPRPTYFRRHVYGHGEQQPFRSNNQLKEDALRAAIANPQMEPDADSEITDQQTEHLKTLIGNLKSR